jgi:hypothetical protein
MSERSAALLTWMVMVALVEVMLLGEVEPRVKRS